MTIDPNKRKILWPKSFREAFCEHFRCPPEKYEEYVFQRCLQRHAYVLGRLLHAYTPGRFREDFDLIRDVAPMRDPDVFRNELNRFHGRNVRDKSWVRGTFGIRISAKRLIRLKNKVFGM